MYSPLNLTWPKLDLARFPFDKKELLLPYDAADELLMEWWKKQETALENVWIINDGFGALTCFFHQQSKAQIHHITDSFLARRAAANNIDYNRLDPKRIEFSDCLADSPAQPQLIVLKVPKSLTLFQHQLAKIGELPAGIPVVIGARLKELPAKAIKLLKEAFGNVVPENARRKSRIMHGVTTGTAMPLPEQSSWDVPSVELTLHNHANVFSRNSLDVAARLFLEHLPETTPNATVVDLGCGNGVLALAMARTQPTNEYILIDESFMAIESAKLNQQQNFPDLSEKFYFLCQHSMVGTPPNSVDYVVCNPPFHQQQTITDEIAWQMFSQAYRALKVGGKLRIIGNRHLGYNFKLERLFGETEIIASNAKFVILESVKKEAVKNA